MARRGRPAAPLVLTDDERETLERWARRPNSAQALATRCRIVLACAEGATNQEAAAELGVHQSTVGKWRARFVATGSTVCTTSPALARLARAPMRTWSG